MRPPPTRQHCHANVPPVRVVGLDGVVDSTALAVRIRDAARALRGHAVFIVGVDSLGAPVPARIVEHSVPGPMAHQMAEALHATTRHQLPSKQGWGVLVRADLADSIRFRVALQEECSPALANRREVQRVLERGFEIVARRDPQAERVLSTDDARSLRMRVYIDTLGVVQTAEPLKILQHRALDSLAMSISRQFRFHPALHNRRPVPVWVELPVGFKLEPSPADSVRSRAGW